MPSLEENEAFDRAIEAAETKISEGASTDLVEDVAIKEILDKEESAEPKAAEPKARAKDGKFTKAVKEEPVSTDQDAETGEQEPEPQATEEVAQEEQTPAIEPPVFWSTEDKTAFSKAPPEVQQAFLKYEAQRTQWANRVAEEAKQGKAIEQRSKEVFDPYRLKLEAQGIKDPFAAVERLLAWNEIFEKDARACIKDLMRKNGLTPHDLVDDGSEQSQNNPEVEEAIREAKAAKELAESLKNQYEQRAEADLVRQINAFKSGKDSQGRERRQLTELYAPQIDKVASIVEKQNPGMPFEEVLHHAYEYVVGEAQKTFGISTSTIKPQLKPVPAAKAKVAASGLTGAPITGAAPRRSPVKSVDEAIDRAMERQGS